MKAIFTLMLKRVVAWLAGVSWSDVMRCVSWVAAAAKTYPKPADPDDITPAAAAEISAQRRDYVLALLANGMPAMSASQHNYTLETAVQLARKEAQP